MPDHLAAYRLNRALHDDIDSEFTGYSGPVRLHLLVAQHARERAAYFHRFSGQLGH